MVLQADVAAFRAGTADGLVPDLSFGHFLAFGVFVDELAIHAHAGEFAAQFDLHRVPLAARLLLAGSDFRDGIDRAGGVPVVAAGVDLDFVAVVHAVPGIGGRLGQADDDARVGAFAVGHVHDADHGIAEGLPFVVEQAHAALGDHLALFDDEAAGAGHLPAVEVLSVEQLFPSAQQGPGGDESGEDEFVHDETEPP